jgi:hypothetical protein
MNEKGLVVEGTPFTLIVLVLAISCILQVPQPLPQEAAPAHGIQAGVVVGQVLQSEVVELVHGRQVGVLGFGIRELVVLPAKSLIVSVAGNTNVPFVVSVHITLASVLTGVGTQVVPGIVTVDDGSAFTQLTTIGDVFDTVQLGALGATVSIATGIDFGTRSETAIFPARSLTVTNTGNKIELVVVSVHFTIPVESAGDGKQLALGNVTVAPVSTPVQVIIVFVVLAVQIGFAGGIISICGVGLAGPAGSTM